MSETLLGRAAAGPAGSFASDRACLLRGTMILTPAGELPVEALAAGDTVLVLGGGRRRIVRATRRTLDLRRHPDPAAVQPIRFRRGALGNGMPTRDLLVSPDHALYLTGRLIPARALVNGATVQPDPSQPLLDYVSVTLDAHDLLLANGAAVESLPLRDGAAAGRVVVLHPRFANTPPARSDCAPRFAEGPSVQSARRLLLNRARVLGHALVHQPDLHLLVDGTRLNAALVNGALHSFALPPGACDVRVVSRAGVPAELDATADDRRRLGVRLARVVVRGPGGAADLPLGEASPQDGFHAAEPAGGGFARWTDGHARLPALPPGTTVLDLHVLGSQPSWARTTPPAAPAHLTRSLP